MKDSSSSDLAYAASGVDTQRASEFLGGLLSWVNKTSELRPGIGRPLLDIGYFASVVDIGRGMGLAIATDGVGTKILVAEMAERYDTIGIDCVAMNVNDLICVGAEPVAMVDYLAVQDTDPAVGEQLGKGLYEGARQAEIVIPGGELAILRDMVAGVRENSGLDLAGAAVGLVEITDINIGRDLKPGDKVISIASSGLHSNGFTLARKTLLETAGLSLDTVLDSVGRPLGDELLEPTHIYVPEFKRLKHQKVTMHSLANITGDGLFNLTRVDAPVGFVIDRLPPPPPIFSEIQERGNISDAEMYEVFNMGIGFCVVVPENEVRDALSALAGCSRKVDVIGEVVDDPDKKVTIPGLHLTGKNGHFFKT